MRFRKKPVVVEAFQWTGDLIKDDPPKWFDDAMDKTWTSEGSARFLVGTDSIWIQISTLEGIHRASIGDWIIQGVDGEIYPCKPEIFKKTYEEVQKKATDEHDK